VPSQLPPTDRQLEVLRLVAQGGESGPAPTFKEMADQLGLESDSAVGFHLNALEKRGLVERRKKSSRSVRLTKLGRKQLGMRRCRACGTEVLQ
jgi:SOS-response transcriptional repressor LexA